MTEGAETYVPQSEDELGTVQLTNAQCAAAASKPDNELRYSREEEPHIGTNPRGYSTYNDQRATIPTCLPVLRPLSPP